MPMNEGIFIIQIICVMLFTLGAVRLGKEALIALIAIEGALANIFVLKQITCFGLHITCTDVFAIGCIMGLNLLQEYFGKDSSKLASWICFFLLAFVAMMSQLHLAFLPSPFDTAHHAYNAIFAAAPRLVLASLTVFFLVQRFDITLYGWLKNKIPRVPHAIRGSLSIILSQGLDTFLFTLLGLYGLVDHLLHIMLFSMLIKLCIIASMSPFLTLTKRFVNDVRS